MIYIKSDFSESARQMQDEGEGSPQLITISNEPEVFSLGDESINLFFIRNIDEMIGSKAKVLEEDILDSIGNDKEIDFWA